MEPLWTTVNPPLSASARPLPAAMRHEVGLEQKCKVKKNNAPKNYALTVFLANASIASFQPNVI